MKDNTHDTATSTGNAAVESLPCSQNVDTDSEHPHQMMDVHDVECP